MKSYILGVWSAIDPIYYSFTRLRYVTDDNKCNTLFRVRLTRYKGKTVVLNDGTKINKNDLLLKIHLHNVRMLNESNQINSEVKRGVYVYHMIKRSLPRLANFILVQQKYANVKGIIGITTLHRGADRLGFEIIPINNSLYRLFKTATFLPINLLGNNSTHQSPAYLFMTKEQLIRLYNV